MRDGFLIPDPVVSRAGNAGVFLKPKSSEKASFIADLRRVNSLFVPPKFSLPSLMDISDFITSKPAGSLWGTTIDLKNFFWSLELPLHARGAFRVGGMIWTSLPFGWNLSPIIAQETLGQLLREALTPFEGESVTWRTFHCYDDVLILAASPSLCSSLTQCLLSFLRSRSFVISPKSHTDPTQDVLWLGKRFSLGSPVITNTPSCMLHSLALCLLYATIPLHSQLTNRFTGYLLWAIRPHKGASLKLRAYYTYPWAKRRCLPRLTPRMLEFLGDCVFFALLPWRAPALAPPPLLCPVWCVDAAATASGFQVGLYTPLLGGRVVRCPPEVATQQQAELYALDVATRLGTRLGLPYLTIVGDNQAMLQVLLHLRPSLGNQTMVRVARRIRNRLLWSGLLVHALWCPTALQPADPLSRWDPGSDPSSWHATFQASERWDLMCTFWATLQHLGSTQLHPPTHPRRME